MPDGANRLDLTLLDDARIMGGGQRFAIRLARHVRSQGGEFRVVAPAGSQLAERCRQESIELLAADFPDPSPRLVQRLFVAAVRLRGVLRRLPADTILIGNSARCQALATAALIGSRRVLVNLMHERDSADRATARIVHRRGGRIVVTGTAAADAYARALGVEVHAINNFLEAGEYASLAARRERFPGAAAPVLGVLARLIPEKGVLELVSELAGDAGAWSALRVAGAAESEAYVARLHGAIREADLGARVQLLGAVTDVPTFLETIDVLIVPSTGNEGQPTVILEGLAAGRAVLVRSAIHTGDFEGLPVAPFRDGGELLAALTALPASGVALDELERRFGARQALDGLLAAAGRPARGELGDQG